LSGFADTYLHSSLVARLLLILKSNRQTLSEEDGAMRANGSVVRGHGIPTLSDLVCAVKEWAGRNVTQERIAEAALGLVTLALVGYMFFVLNQAIQNRTVVGF
jgi:hypothetical protein